jgi:hypothetical protein
MGESCGAANAGHEYGFLGRQLLVATQSLGCRQDAVVAASRAPAGYATLILLEVMELLVDF